MKKMILFLFLLSTCLYAQVVGKERSIVCLNMIVKNEAHVITRCLESVLPLVDTYVIVDTGSTDGTQDVIRNYMAEKNIPGVVYDRPWVNFAHNRNQALELGSDQADYLLFMDADDILTYEPAYKRPDLFTKDAYYIHIHYSGTHYDRIVLTSTKFPFKWMGAVHEVIYCEEARDCTYLDGVTMEIIGGGGRSKDPNKFLKDVQMLADDLKIDPNNSRTMFYLAQSYRDADLLEESIEHYEKRTAMGGWNQEIFWSLYQIGYIQEKLEMPKDIVIASYYRAFDYRPSRAEPLYKIASIHRKAGEFHQAFLLLTLASTLKQPNDLMFVEATVYDFFIPYELTICSLFLGLYQEAFNTSLKLLSNPNTPDDIRKSVEHNLQLIIQGMNKTPVAYSQAS